MPYYSKLFSYPPAVQQSLIEYRIYDKWGRFYPANLTKKDEDGNTPLHLAAIQGYTVTARALIQLGAPLEQENNTGDTPLHCATQFGHVNTTEMLLQHGAQIEASNHEGNTALHMAVLNKMQFTANTLISYQANIHARNSLGEMPIHSAAEVGHLGLLNMLVDKGADPNALDSAKNTPAHIAAYHDRYKIIRQLATAHRVKYLPNEDGDLPMHIAAKYNRYYCMQEIIADYPDLMVTNNAQDRPLKLVCEQAESSQTALLILNHIKRWYPDYSKDQVGEDLASNDNLLLRIVATENSLQNLKDLLEFTPVKANATANNNEALRNAKGLKRDLFVKELLSIPEISSYEQAHPEDTQATLRTTATNSENAMQALSEEQKGMLNELEKAYGEEFHKKGADAIAKALEDFLKEKFQAKKLSATYKSGERQVNYYKNPYHCAYRYFFLRPNPWISRNAKYVTQVGTGSAAIISDLDRKLMLLFWLAASDGKAKCLKGFSVENRQTIWINIMAALARAHNWDNPPRYNKKTKKLEAYDDMGPDRPTCAMGVEQRASQILLGHPLAQIGVFKSLDADVMMTFFREQLITGDDKQFSIFNKLEKLDLKQLQQLLAGFNELVINLWDFEELSAEAKSAFNLFTIPAADLQRFVETSKNWFGETRITAKKKIKFQEKSFEEGYIPLIEFLSHNMLNVYYDFLKAKIATLIEVKSKPTPEVKVKPAYTPGFKQQPIKPYLSVKSEQRKNHARPNNRFHSLGTFNIS